MAERTLFLDEIGEMPESVQVRLLRILQDGSFDRLGGRHSIRVDVRVIAATHRDLFEMVKSGSFREDLWYRISTFPIIVPALRERHEDFPQLAAFFAEKYAKQFGVPTPDITESDIELLKRYSWPGNVREFQAVLARAVLLSKGEKLELDKAIGLSVSDGPGAAIAPTGGLDQGVNENLELETVNRLHIERTLSHTLGRIDGPFGAAKVLNIHPNTLRSRMKKLKIDARRFKKSA